MSSIDNDGAAPTEDCPTENDDSPTVSSRAQEKRENINGGQIVADHETDTPSMDESHDTNKIPVSSDPSSSLSELPHQEPGGNNNFPVEKGDDKNNGDSGPRVGLGHVSNGTDSSESRRADARHGVPLIKNANNDPINHSKKKTSASQVDKAQFHEDNQLTMKPEETSYGTASEEPVRPASDPDGACERSRSQVFSTHMLSKIHGSRFDGEPELETVLEVPPSPPGTPSMGSPLPNEKDVIRNPTVALDAIDMGTPQIETQPGANSDIRDEEASSDNASPQIEDRSFEAPDSSNTEKNPGGSDNSEIENGVSRSRDATSPPAEVLNSSHHRDPSAVHSSEDPSRINGFMTPPPSMSPIPIEVNASLPRRAAQPPEAYSMESDISAVSVHSTSVRQDSTLYSHSNVEGLSMQQQPVLVVQGNYRASAPTSAAPFPGYAVHAMAPGFQPMHPPNSFMMGGNGKRRIHLRLSEDVAQPVDRRSLFGSFRRSNRTPFTFPSKTQISDFGSQSIDSPQQGIDRGSMTVSWYEGTTSLELQEHVRTSLVRKLGLKGTVKLDYFRILDESVQPAEEIVLCPFIPDGSKFLLRFTTKDAGGDTSPVGPMDPRYQQRMLTSGPPDSPSAAPSPLPSSTDLNGLGLNANQLAMLGSRLNSLQVPSINDLEPAVKTKRRYERKSSASGQGSPPPPPPKTEGNGGEYDATSEQPDEGEFQPSAEYGVRKVDDDAQSKTSYMETASLHPEDPIEARLRQITELLVAERTKQYPPIPYAPTRKRDVVFVLANYFVLFISLIAISAEIQSRAPAWNKAMEEQFQNVHRCATDQDALFECVSNGDFAGLVAAVILWISRSAATKRVFLFGFESPRKLWNVVYESLVTAVCWGFSYMFIRRGMNPDTKDNFLQKYWKDAVYGSLAGFNAAFMKHVLKNLIPQEAIEDAFQDRQLKILSWLPSFSH